ncbi:hypothetical protein BSPWISOXPB_5548 [uncultured Gammaproteobacteria bacterium]|nr:hypothetical protein BSPWISOXPB_5548 [uncultured Gammaproteobacteria bacterium]
MDANGYDKLQFGEGITKEDVSLYQDNCIFTRSFKNW